MKERSRVVKDGELVTKGKVIFFCLFACFCCFASGSDEGKKRDLGNERRS